MKTTCSICNTNPRPLKSKHCNPCHARYMRQWRKTHPLNAEQKRKDICRSYAHQYLKRGKIIKELCKKCGDINSQMHHPDYNKPLLIEWYCRPCHLGLHATTLPTSLE